MGSWSDRSSILAISATRTWRFRPRLSSSRPMESQVARSRFSGMAARRGAFAFRRTWSGRGYGRPVATTVGLTAGRVVLYKVRFNADGWRGRTIGLQGPRSDIWHGRGGSLRGFLRRTKPIRAAPVRKRSCHVGRGPLPYGRGSDRASQTRSVKTGICGAIGSCVLG